jgi:hypothetical protein
MLLLRPQDEGQLQIFLRNKYNQYQSTSCDSLESTHAQHLLASSRDSYFQNIFEFLLIETLRTRNFRHCFQENKFVPLVPCSILTNQISQSEAIEELRRVVDVVSALRDPNGPFTFCTCFDSELWNKWAQTEDMRRYVLKSEHELFRIFLLDDYFAIMSDVLKKVEQTGVRAKVLPDEGCTDSKELLKGKALLDFRNVRDG